MTFHETWLHSLGALCHLKTWGSVPNYCDFKMAAAEVQSKCSLKSSALCHYTGHAPVNVVFPGI